MPQEPLGTAKRPWNLLQREGGAHHPGEPREGEGDEDDGEGEGSEGEDAGDSGQTDDDDEEEEGEEQDSNDDSLRHGFRNSPVDPFRGRMP